MRPYFVRVSIGTGFKPVFNWFQSTALPAQLQLAQKLNVYKNFDADNSTHLLGTEEQSTSSCTKGRSTTSCREGRPSTTSRTFDRLSCTLPLYLQTNIKHLHWKLVVFDGLTLNNILTSIIFIFNTKHISTSIKIVDGLFYIYSIVHKLST